MFVPKVNSSPFLCSLRSAFVSKSMQRSTHTVGVTAIRRASFSSNISRTFSTEHKRLLDTTAYTVFQKLTNSEKEKKVFEHTLDQLLVKFEVRTTAFTIKEKWEQLQTNLESSYSYQLPAYNEQSFLENTQNLFSISYPFLISNGQPVRRFGLQDYVSTISEFQWALSQVSYPFTRLEGVCL